MARQVSSDGKDKLRAREGFSEVPYLDAGNVWTIGFGETKGITATTPPMSREAATVLFNARVDGDFAGPVDDLIGNALTTQGQFDAMVSLAYNIGVPAFSRSTVLAAHKRGDYESATRAFALWNKVKGTVIPGLVKRRAEEAAQYMDGADESIGNVAPDENSEKPLAASRTMSGGTIATITAGASVAAQLSGSVKETVENLGGWSSLVDNGILVLSIISMIAVGYMVYCRWDEKRQGRG